MRLWPPKCAHTPIACVFVCILHMWQWAENENLIIVRETRCGLICLFNFLSLFFSLFFFLLVCNWWTDVAEENNDFLQFYIVFPLLCRSHRSWNYTPIYVVRAPDSTTRANLNLSKEQTTELHFQNNKTKTEHEINMNEWKQKNCKKFINYSIWPAAQFRFRVFTVRTSFPLFGLCALIIIIVLSFLVACDCCCWPHSFWFAQKKILAETRKMTNRNWNE